MKSSDLLIPTIKEIPSEAKNLSHKLMIKSGMISKLSSGIYSYLPIGLIVLQKIKRIIREEMNKSGAQEILMPISQPAELWQESGRWEEYGPELLRFQDRHDRDFCMGPTHEEVVTDIAKQYIRSYKQLPINLYQIQTKFRDEIRPRFGVIRSREFIMKDAYSFHIDEKSLLDTYNLMHKTYCNIFDRIGLKYRAVLADSGNIGGDKSHEFHVLADSGEDLICFSDESDYAANIETAKTFIQEEKKPAQKDLELINTPNAKTVNEVCDTLKIKPQNLVKTLIVKGSNNDLLALVIRGDHDLNEVKAAKAIGLPKAVEMASKDEILEVFNCSAGFIGVINSPVKIIVDYAASSLTDFVCGANVNDKHFIGVNWGRDVADFIQADLRNVVAGEPSPDGKGKLEIKKGIEVGHIFQLGTKYSSAMKANIVAENGKSINMHMGCYGIGVTRIMAASIEQGNDERGIIFPQAIAPFTLIILPINYNKSSRVKAMADDIYNKFLQNNVEVLLEDRKKRAGVIFADADLLGIPHRIVISDKNIDNNTLEYKSRKSSDSVEIDFDNAIDFVMAKINK